MPRHVVLLRGINLGANNRLSMPDLRTALAQAGFGGVQTYLQSGNIALSYERGTDDLVTEFERLLVERFALPVAVMTRTRGQLATVVDANPFPEAAAADPKRFQVSFLSEEPDAGAVEKIAALAQAGELLSVAGRELYAYHPANIHTSKLALALTPKKLGVRCATARNWTTVMALLEMASDGE